MHGQPNIKKQWCVSYRFVDSCQQTCMTYTTAVCTNRWVFTISAENYNVFDVRVTEHHDKFLIIKPTRCTNFSNLFLEWNSTCFGQFLCPSSGVFHCTHSKGICHKGVLTAVSKPLWHTPLLFVQWETPDDGQRNCPKHGEFHSKNKFEKLVHLVGFTVRNYNIYRVIRNYCWGFNNLSYTTHLR